MGVFACKQCNDGVWHTPGSGRIADPDRKWWQIWKTVTCPSCGGDGIKKPRGWPDKGEMEKHRPSPPSAPPRPDHQCCCSCHRK